MTAPAQNNTDNSTRQDAKISNKLRIYTLNGLPPEVIAVAFAKCSRSPEPFDVIAKELNEDKSRKFHEKWVVSYGHSSVAEHAVLSLAIENVSILATKVVEDNRLASYTEKSTRYQQFDKSRYYIPELNPELQKIYTQTMDFILDKYSALIPALTEYIKKKYPNAQEIEVKNRVFDNLRNMLPVSVLTNLGMTVNARSLEHAIVKMMTSPLKEIRDIGAEIKKAASNITPTLIKYTHPNAYIQETVQSMEKKCASLSAEMPDEAKPVVLVEYDMDAEEKIVSSILYRFSNLPYSQIKSRISTMSEDAKHDLIKESLSRIGKFDAPLREFEHASYTFDILIDYGAFRDIQRHRMMTQTNQDFTPIYGFDVPIEVKEAGFEKDYVECMKNAKKAYKVISESFPKEAQYILPMAFNKRVLFKANLRELFHFIKLRSTKHGHESYRRIAQEMHKELLRVHPFLAGFIQCEY